MSRQGAPPSHHPFAPRGASHSHGGPYGHYTGSTGCEHPPSFPRSLSPAVHTVSHLGAEPHSEPTTHVLLDGEIGAFSGISRHGGFPTPTHKGVYSSSLRSRRRHPNPASFGFGGFPGVKDLHGVRLREISVPDSLPNVTLSTNRLYINTFFFDNSSNMNLCFQNFVTEIPVNNYLNAPHLLSAVENALGFLRYHAEDKGLEEDHGSNIEYDTFEENNFIHPPMHFTTSYDVIRNRVAIGSYGKVDTRFKKFDQDDTEIYHYVGGTILEDISLSGIVLPSFTVRAEPTTSRGFTEKISNVKIVDVSYTDAIKDDNTVSTTFRFLEFSVAPGLHNLAVGDRVKLLDVSIAGTTAAVDSTSVRHVAYVRKGKGAKDSDVLRLYLYTNATGPVVDTTVELGDNPRISILDKGLNNVAPMLGFRHHTRLGLGCKIRNVVEEEFPFTADNACVSRGSVELTRNDVTSGSSQTYLTFKSVAQPLFPPQTHDKGKDKTPATATFQYDNVENRSYDLGVLDTSCGAALYVNNVFDQGLAQNNFPVARDVSIKEINNTTVPDNNELRSANCIRVKRATSEWTDDFSSLTYLTTSFENLVYPTAYWGWKKEAVDVSFYNGISNWDVTFGTANLSMSHLNQYALVRLVRNGEQLGNIVTPQSRRTGKKYLAKLHFRRGIEGETGRLTTISTGGVHVFKSPVREDSVSTTGGDDSPDELYTIELVDQHENLLEVNGEEWDFALEFLSFV